MSEQVETKPTSKVETTAHKVNPPKKKVSLAAKFKKRASSVKEAINSRKLIQASMVENLATNLGSFDQQIKERASRFLMDVIAVLLFVIMGFVLLIYLLLPLKKEVPYLVQFGATDNRVVKVTPANSDSTTLKQTELWFARNYVWLRNSILGKEVDMSDYSLVQYRSSKEIKERFVATYGPVNRNSPYKQAIAGNYRVYVHIKGTSMLSDNTVRVDYTKRYVDIKTSRDIKSLKEYTANVVVEQKKIKYHGNEYLNNPFGLLVTGYSEQFVGEVK